MGLLAPWFLAGLAALAVPVYLHLLRRRQTTAQKFSSLMFFERRPDTSVKHRRLDYRVLFALRALMILLLALAFANPFIEREVIAAQGRKTVVLALDRSFSMRSGSNLERAKAQAIEVASSGSGAILQPLAFGANVELLGEPSPDAAGTRAAIESVQAADSRSSFGELARSLRAIAETAPGPLEVHIFSDFQKSALPGSFSDLRLEPNTELKFHSVVSGGAPENWAVETVTAPARLYGQSKAKVQATIAGYNTPASTRTVTLMLNRKPVKSQTVQVPANGRASIEFVGIDAPYGLNRGEVAIEANDGLAQDNRFLFSLPRFEQSNLLVIHSAADKRSPVYLKAALEASSNRAFSVDVSSAGQASTLALRKYAAIFLADPGSLSTKLDSGLRDYLSAGGGILLAAGPNSAAENRSGIAGLRFSSNKYVDREGALFQSVAQSDTTHPVLRSAARWEGVRIYRYTKPDFQEGRVLLRLSDQSPLLVELNSGQGRMLVFTSSFDNVSNDLPLQPLFVPFLEQAAYYLSGVEQSSSTLAVDSFIDLRAGVEKGVQVELIDHQGDRPLSLSQATSLETWQLPAEGFFEVRRGQASPQLIAANADRRESDLAPIEQETLDLWKNTGTESETAATVAREAGANKKPFTFWWYLLIALLGLSIAESIYASRYLSREREAA